MKSKQFGNRFIVRIDKGEEAVSCLKEFCAKNSITLGYITAIGAAEKVTLGFFDTKTKVYHSKELSGGFEIAPLYGNISTKDGETYLHLHANVCDRNLNSFGGHLNSALISATLECVIEIIDGKIGRFPDSETGLNLYDL